MKAVQLINTNANTPVVITKGKAMAAIGSAQFKGPLCAVSQCHRYVSARSTCCQWRRTAALGRRPVEQFGL